MRYFFFGVLFLSFSLLFSQNTNDTSAVSRAKSFYSKGETKRAWILLSQSLQKSTKLYNLEAVELATDWYLQEKRTTEALALLENVLPTIYRMDKARILLKRIDCYLKMGNNLAACADLGEAEYLGMSANELASRKKVSCPTSDIYAITANQVFNYEIDRYQHDQPKYALDITIHSNTEGEIADYEWLKVNTQEKGMVLLNEEEQLNGIMETRYLDLENPVLENGQAQEGANGDVHLAFMAPRNKFYLLLEGKMPLYLRNVENVFVSIRKQKLLVMVEGMDKLLDCIYAKSGENEIWVLDNKKYPIIVRTNLNSTTATLKEIR